jgi:hypothetical protein
MPFLAGFAQVAQRVDRFAVCKVAKVGQEAQFVPDLKPFRGSVLRKAACNSGNGMGWKAAGTFCG